MKVSLSKNLERDAQLYTFIDSQTAYIQIAFPKPIIVNNINIPIQNSKDNALDSLSFTVMGKDAANGISYVRYGSANVSSKILATQFIRVHPSGRVSAMRFEVNGQPGQSFRIKSMKVNARRPFGFSPLRLAVLLFVAYSIFVFLPRSRIYRQPLGSSVKKESIQIAAFVTIQIVIALAITRLAIPRSMFSGTSLMNNGAFISDNNQYNHLTDALLNGHTYLDLPVPSWMTDMPNPYDAADRAAHSLKTGQPTYWDYAFYNGKYYSYFGILPVLLTFLPFKFVTGLDLRTDYSVCFFAVLFVIASVFMIKAFLKKYFPESSVGFLLLSSMAFITGSSFLTQLFQPMIYSLPILCSATLTFAGLSFWLCARKGNGILSRWCLGIGALLISLNLLSRPIFVVGVLFAFPIFWKEIFTERVFFSWKGLKNTLAVIIPFVPSFIAAGTYNFVRFGAVTEFGASFNLTGFDMVHRSFSVAKTVQGLYMYFVQPITLTPEFPFIQVSSTTFPAMSEIFVEPFYGSIFALAPITIFIFARQIVHRDIKQRNLLGFVDLALALSLAIVIIDSSVASISMRYYGDFAWMLLIVAIAVCASAMSSSSGPFSRNLLILLAVLILFEMLVNYGNLFSNGRYYALSSSNSGLFEYVKSWFLFLQ
jgi:hypothetical protein